MTIRSLPTRSYALKHRDARGESRLLIARDEPAMQGMSNERKRSAKASGK